MSSKNESSSKKGMGITGVLTVVFLVLKLTGTIGWSWWWVLSPLWISAAIYIVALVIILLVNLIADPKK